jgi:serine/threonine-protein kinase
MPDTNSWAVPDNRFEQVLAEILLAEEAGQPLELPCVFQTYPELETPLREYFHNRDSFNRLAPRLGLTAGHPGAVPPEPPPVRHIGGYAVLEKVGQGGRGVVYRVSDPELHRPLAVKVLRPELRDDPDAGRRFLEEAQVMGQLQHPGIVPVHSLGQLPDGRPYFAMKLVQGQTLAKLLAQRSAAADDRPRWLAIFQQLCQAVAYAHSRGVIHRDLKPANVMVGAFGEVQVMDWGLAKVLSTEAVIPEPARDEPDLLVAGAADTIRTTRTGTEGVSSADGLVVGTFAYMAPEQAQGRVEQLDRRADVFGLGALLCELLTSRPPYCETSGWKLHQMAMAGNLVDAFARLDGCGADAELIALAKDCMAPEREHRPRDAAAVAERLATYLAELQERLRRAELEKAAAQARAEEARATARAERRARRLTVGLALAVLAVVVSLTGAGLWLQRQQAREAQQAEALRREVGAALAQAIHFRQDAHFKESRELLEQAQQRLGTDGPADLRRQVDQALADTDLAERLDAARKRGLTAVGGKMDFDGAEREYAAAFKKAGLGQEGEAPTVVASRVPSTVRAEVVAALDDWASIAGDERRRRWLLAVARAADPDPERDRLRQPKLWRDGAALARLAWETRVAELSPQLAMALGRALLESGGDPIPLLRKAQGHHPQDFWLNFGLAGSLNLAKQWDEAIGYYRAALALRPEAAVHSNFGTVLRDKGRLDEAIGHYEKALRINPNHASAHNNLGVALCDKGRLDEAIDHYKKALRIDPKFTSAHNNLGAALYEKGQWDKAVGHYKKALRIDRNNAQAHYNLGDALRDKRRLDEAIGHYKKALLSEPNNADIHINFGIALCLNGQLDEAIRHYEKALRINAKDSDALYNLGLTMYLNDRHDEAVAYYEKALRIMEPKYANANYNLGLALYAKGRHDEAVSHYKEVLRLDPKNAQAHGALGQALLALGRFVEAREATRRCLKLLPPWHPQRPAVMQQLQQCREALRKQSRESKQK